MDLTDVTLLSVNLSDSPGFNGTYELRQSILSQEISVWKDGKRLARLNSITGLLTHIVANRLKGVSNVQGK